MAVTDLRVIFAGTPEVAVPALRALQASKHDVVAVLSKPDARSGRGRTLAPSPVSVAARELDLPLHTPENLHGIGELLTETDADAVAVVAYGQLVPTSVLGLDRPRFGWINAHFSLLPAWRGAAPVQHAIGAGNRQTGVTTFRIDPGLDTGPVLLRSAPVDIGDREDSGHLLTRLAPLGADLLVRTLDGLANDAIPPQPQGEEGVSHAPRITVEDARIDWTRPVVEVDRWIRACTPAPGAWTTLDGERLRIGTPVAVEVDSAAVPGRFQVDRRAVRIGVAGGYLVLGEVQAHGKKVMPADAWARGLRGDIPDAV